MHATGNALSEVLDKTKGERTHLFEVLYISEGEHTHCLKFSMYLRARVLAV